MRLQATNLPFVTVPTKEKNTERVVTLAKIRSPFSYFHVTGLDISARPLAQASVKSVGRVQITDHSPVWRVRFFIAKKLIKLQNKRCFLYSVSLNTILP